MNKILISFSLFFTFSQLSLASDLTVTSCEDVGLTLNSVFSMKTYANESIKVFEVDMEEPAYAPVGIAVTIDRGDDLSTRESYCRFVSGLSSVDLKNIKSSYSQKTGLLTLSLKAIKSNEEGEGISKILTIKINKNAKLESELVNASVK